LLDTNNNAISKVRYRKFVTCARFEGICRSGVIHGVATPVLNVDSGCSFVGSFNPQVALLPGREP